MPTQYSYAKTRRRQPPNNRRSYSVARTRRQTGAAKKRQQSATRLVKSAGGLKTLNSRRANVGLPEIELKYSTKFQGNQQWAAGGAAVWSHEEDLNLVAVGDDENTREGNKLKFVPTKFKLFIDQAASTEYDYRVLVVKDFDMRSNSLKPEDIFYNSSYWTTSVYKPMSLGADGERRFKVILDKSFRFNTYAPNSTRKGIKINLPSTNVTYDDDEVTGVQKKNALWLFIRTNAPDTNASYNFDYMVFYKFLDQ